MAAHQIGKLKWKISKDGLQFKYGEDGEIKTFFGSKKEPVQPEYDDYGTDDSDYAYGEEYTEPNDYYADLPSEENDGGYYADDAQQNEETGYAGEEMEGSRMDRILDYIDANAWVLYLLLVVIPPLGIYL